MASLAQTSTSIAGSSNSQSTITEYTVRAPSTLAKKFSMIKFSSGTNIDFLKLTNTSVKMERQNNFKEYKSAHNIDTMPKFGAGSEYGREQKEEARRKKYGIDVKKYNPEDQPWLMKVGKGKDAKRFKGGREGTITENTSYYIFTQCADGAFEAFPVEEWYNFQPIVNYKYLNSEEAEEEFSRRDKTMNLFSIMLKKRIRNEEDTGETEEGEKKEKTKTKKDKSLILTDMEDWTAMSDEEEDEEGEMEETEQKPKKDKKGKAKKRRKNAKLNDNDEAVEESDEGDFDDRELDYISDSGSESDMDDKEKEEKYDDKGVDQEQGLKKLIDSEEEDSEEEEENKEEDEEQDEEQEQDTEKKAKGKKKEAKNGEESDSSSSSSESDDSDIEKNEEKFSSVLFMQKKKGSSRSSTPTVEKPAAESVKTESKTEAVKRKVEPDDSPDQQKKMRTESPSASPAAYLASGEITEEAIRRYLMRKPMTAKDLVQKFKSKKPQMSKEQMTQKIGQLLKKINPDRKYVNNVLYLSVKKTD